jgi:hypothetical protein
MKGDGNKAGRSIMRDGHVDAVSRKFVAGWAADSERPESALILSIWVDGVRRGLTKANRLRTDLARTSQWGGGHHGFRFSFGEALSADSDHLIAVRFEDGTLLSEGEQWLRGEGPLVAADPVGAEAKAPVPVIVTAPGRSGTTLLMGLLARSPDIVAAELPPYELRLLSYYAVAFHVLTGPADVQNSTHPDRLAGDNVHVGFNPFNGPSYAEAWQGKPALTDYTEVYLPTALAGAMRGIVTEYYRRLAADKGKPEARYFAEKTNNLHRRTRSFIRRAFPGMREIVIVRDPRDVICSHIAYFHSSAETAFRDLAQVPRQLMAIRRDARADTLMIRYEDLVRGEAGCFAALSEFLGTSITPLTQDQGQAIFHGHATSATPEASLQRWRTGLPAELVPRCAERWGDFLEMFGYQIN